MVSNLVAEPALVAVLLSSHLLEGSSPRLEADVFSQVSGSPVLIDVHCFQAPSGIHRTEPARDETQRAKEASDAPHQELPESAWARAQPIEDLRNQRTMMPFGLLDSPY